MGWGLGAAAAIGALVAVAGTSSSCAWSCLDQRCPEEVAVNVHLPTAWFIPGHYTLTVTPEAQTPTTTDFDIVFPGQAAGISSLFPGCNTPGGCSDPLGASTFIVSLQGAPDSVDVKETRDGEQVFDVSGGIPYENEQSNGFVSVDFDLTGEP